MKRPLCVMGLAFALAVRVAFSFVRNPRAMLLCSLALALTAAVALLLVRRERRWMALCLALLSAAAGMGVCWSYTARFLAPFQLPEGETVTIRGIVEEASYSPSSARYTVLADFPHREDLPDRQRIVLRQYGEWALLPGDCLEGTAKLEGVDLASLRSLAGGVRASAYAAGELERAALEEYRWNRLVLMARQRLRQNLLAALPPESAGLAGAMALGQRDMIRQEDEQALSRSGSVHLLAVSGLHLSVLSGLLLELLRRMKLARWARTALALLFCLAFAALVGFSASVLRALLMLAMAQLAGLIGRRNDSINSLGFALLFVSLLWPHWTLGQGIWLSFAATLGILVAGQPLARRLVGRSRCAHPRLAKLERGMLSAAGISLGAYLFTLPLLLWSYGWVSLIAPLTNVALSPFIGVALPGALLCALFGGAVWLRPVAWITHGCLRMILGVSRLCAALPFATAALDQPWMLLWLAFAAGAGGLLLYWRADRRLTGYALALCLLIYGVGGATERLSAHGKVEVVTLEGSSAALLLRDRQAVVLGTPTPYEVSGLLRYLDYRGIRRISAVFATDSGDQVGSGLLRLAQAYEVDCVISPDDLYVAGQIAAALPEIPVYPGGYAAVGVLGGVRARFDLHSGDMMLTIGGHELLKTAREYAIIENNFITHIYSDGILVPARETAPLWEPGGGRLFGETRLLLEL